MIGSLFAGHEESPGQHGRGRRQALQGVLRLGLATSTRASTSTSRASASSSRSRAGSPTRCARCSEDVQSSISYAGGTQLADIRKVNYVILGGDNAGEHLLM